MLAAAAAVTLILQLWGALFAVFLLHFGITFSDAFQHSALLTMASFGPIFVVALNYLFIP